MGCIICNMTHGEDEDGKYALENEMAYDIYACHPGIMREIMRLLVDDPLGRRYLRG